MKLLMSTTVALLLGCGPSYREEFMQSDITSLKKRVADLELKMISCQTQSDLFRLEDRLTHRINRQDIEISRLYQNQK